MKKLYRIIFFFSLLLIFYFSVVPASSIPNIAALSFVSDKIIHALIFLYLSYVGLNSYFNLPKLLLLGLIFIFGLAIEIIHFYHPYRFFEVADLISNLSGILLALYIFNKKTN
ncbi:VanZ family protein [Gammaproteobacteria bacterium]|jgi:VanZ family protein|nr:VanZ family protein [Gammaproteobacteria bacterium]MDA9902859.1 VanZ family protein [Gammaproteobacteria bacterium]MDC0401723.1 VanZ family protein [Gammaproteobacteria bacterium]MDC6460260.1 VanZ family protein [Gammaproteobacteria bacterium]